MNSDDINFQQPLSQRGLQFNDAILNERIFSSKRSRAGFLGAVTHVRGEIEILLLNVENAQTVQIQLQRYDDAWRKFEDAHNGYLSLISPHSLVFSDAVQQYNQLYTEKAIFSNRVSKYLQTCVENPIKDVSQNETLSTIQKEHEYAESVTSNRSSISKASSQSSRSSAQEKRVQAAKAKLALRLAEDERNRVLEGEFRLQDIERKQRELETQQKLEEEELKRTKLMETLKQETDRELAQARQQAALANLEAQLQEQFDSYVEVDMELESEIGKRIFSEPAEVISHTHLHEVQNPDKVTTDMATRNSSRTDKTYPSVFNSDPQHEGNPFFSTPATANEPTQPGVIWPEPWRTLAPEYAWGTQVPSNTNVPNQPGATEPRRIPPNPPYVWKTRIPSYLRRDQPRTVDNTRYWHKTTPLYTRPSSQPLTFPYGFQHPTVRRPTPVIPPATLSSPSEISDQDFNSARSKPPEVDIRDTVPISESKPNLVPMKPPYSNQVKSARDPDLFNTVASAMESISLVQQRLASNLNLPPVHLEMFSDSPSEFPMFKQRFENRIMSRHDFSDGEQMLRLLQFLGGEAKEAVKSFEAVKGGVYDAMKILEKRYGKRCLIVSSILDGLTKGPAIQSRDRTALRKFADEAASANATLKSLRCMNEVNQGNLVEMLRRLPKYLRERFAVAASDLEAKENRFPTLNDFAIFLDRWANVANHPINASNTDQQEVPGLAKGKMKYGPEMAWDMGVQGDDSRNIYKSVKITTPYPCCSQAHPIYRCERFKGKTPGERFELAKRKNLCYNCLKSNQIKQLGRTVKHTARSCPSKFKCKIEGCGALHHTLLHKPESLKETSEENDKNIELPTVTSSTATSKAPHAVLLRVIPVRVIGERQVGTTYSMLDSGSEITLVDPSLVKQVGAQGHLDKLVVSTVSNENDVQHGYRINLSVESLIDENPKRLKLTNAWSSKELKIPLRHQRVFQDK